MDNKIIERLEKFEKQKKKQLERQNKYMQEKYDRIALLLPKGSREKISNKAAEKGYKNITEYLKSLIDADLNA